MGYGWTAVPGVVPTGARDEGDERLQLSDVGKLGRLAQRVIVRTARLDDRPTFPKLLAAHLQTGLDDVEVVEESWPPYDLVNVQVGLDAFLAADGVRHELVGMRNHRHREFGLTDLLRPSEHEAYGPHPGNVAWTQLAVRARRPGGAGGARGDVPRHRRRARCRGCSDASGADAPGCRSRVREGAGAAASRRRQAGRGRRRRHRDPAARDRAQRVPRPGDLVRARHVRRTGLAAAVPPPTQRCRPTT